MSRLLNQYGQVGKFLQAVQAQNLGV